MSLISVVIPTRNRSELLLRAIKSVLLQTYENLEIIVVDDNSTDDTKLVIEKLNNPKIEYILSGKRGGAAARNAGIKHSKGEFIAFLDDDDEWLPGKLEKQHNLLSKFPDIALCYTGRTIVREGGALLGLSKKYSFIEPDSDDQYRSIMSDNFIGITSSVIIKKDVLLEINGFDEELPCYQDYELYIRILKKWKSSGINEPLVRYHLTKQTHVSFTRPNVIKAEKILAEKYKDDPFYPLLKRGLKIIHLKKMLKSYHYARTVFSK